jgi:uncharacterized membrane protein YkgB
MPLSEQEQRLLDEMERSLYHNEADDVTTVGARRGRASYTAVLLGVLAAIAGIALLIVGVVVRQPWVGVLGFIIMFGGVVFAIAPPRRLTVARPPHDPSRHGLMDSINERWERRQDDSEH